MLYPKVEECGLRISVGDTQREPAICAQKTITKHSPLGIDALNLKR